MFGISIWEMLLLLAVALIVFGPEKLPELTKSLGRVLGEFRRATTDIKQTIETETGMDKVRDSLNEVKDDIKSKIDLSDSIPDINELSTPSTSDEGYNKSMDQIKEAFDEMNSDPDQTQPDLSSDQNSKAEETGNK